MGLLRSLILALALMGCATPQVAPAVKDSHATTHRIYMSAVFEGGHCSATAIGPHTLLTASHCEMPSSDIEVDGSAMTIVKIVRDGLDHTILYLNNETPFADVAEVDTVNIPSRGDRVHIYGNPGKWTRIYREGYVSGFLRMPTASDDEIAVMLLDLNSFFGDSGSGVFNSDGKIVCVLSAGLTQGTGSDTIKMTGCFPFGFTPKQYEEARGN